MEWLDAFQSWATGLDPLAVMFGVGSVVIVWNMFSLALQRRLFDERVAMSGHNRFLYAIVVIAEALYAAVSWIMMGAMILFLLSGPVGGIIWAMSGWQQPWLAAIIAGTWLVMSGGALAVGYSNRGHQ